MRTFHIDEGGNRVLVADDPNTKRALLAKGYLLAGGGARGARQWALRNGAAVVMVDGP